MSDRRDRHRIRAGALLWPQGVGWHEPRDAAVLADALGVDSLWTCPCPFDRETLVLIPGVRRLVSGTGSAA